MTARYFPVEPKPFAMRAGLFKFPSDFGNGADDARVFQVDAGLERALDAKRIPREAPRYVTRIETPVEARAVQAVLAWATERLRLEAPERLQSAGNDRGAVDAWDALGRAVQEDLVIMHEGAGAGRAVSLHVSFPSGWRPESLAGATFTEIHEPVPTFPGPGSLGDPKTEAASQSMLRSMIDRGPYVRFVWTVRADDALDHHPDHGDRRPWTSTSPGYLRVERQLTWPFPDHRASLFVIRTYVQPFAALTAPEKETLRQAVECMPLAFKAYKGIPEDAALVLRALDSRKES